MTWRLPPPTTNERRGGVVDPRRVMESNITQTLHESWFSSNQVTCAVEELTRGLNLIPPHNAFSTIHLRAQLVAQK